MPDPWPGASISATVPSMGPRFRLRILSAERIVDMVSLTALALLAVAVIAIVFPGL